MPRKERFPLEGNQLELVVDEVKQGDRGVITLLCNESKLNQLLEFARNHLGDRLVSSAVMVDLIISSATEADVELFRKIAAPVEMIIDWEVEATSHAKRERRGQLSLLEGHADA